MDCLAEGNPIKGFPYEFALQIHKRNAVLLFSIESMALKHQVLCY